MQTCRSTPRFEKLVLAGSILVAFILLSACTTAPELPQGALDGLYAEWASLPGSATHDFTILRAWPGKVSPDEPGEAPPSLEVWCVETALSGKQTDAADHDTVLWFVTRSTGEADWLSVPLMAMSSTWPYEACGVGP